MEERNANYPKGIDKGPREINTFSNNSVISRVSSDFPGGLELPWRETKKQTYSLRAQKRPQE